MDPERLMTEDQSQAVQEAPEQLVAPQNKTISRRNALTRVGALLGLGAVIAGARTIFPPKEASAQVSPAPKETPRPPEARPAPKQVNVQSQGNPVPTLIPGHTRDLISVIGRNSTLESPLTPTPADEEGVYTAFSSYEAMEIETNTYRTDSAAKVAGGIERQLFAQHSRRAIDKITFADSVQQSAIDKLAEDLASQGTNRMTMVMLASPVESPFPMGGSEYFDGNGVKHDLGRIEAASFTATSGEKVDLVRVCPPGHGSLRADGKAIWTITGYEYSNAEYMTNLRGVIGYEMAYISIFGVSRTDFDQIPPDVWKANEAKMEERAAAYLDLLQIAPR